MLGIRFAAGKAYALAARCMYATIEGYAFLFSPGGLTLLGAAPWVALARAVGPGRTLGVAAQAAALCVGGRAVWALFHAIQHPDSSGEAASIWEWQPPKSDAYASGAWVILKELALTAQKMKETTPEVAALMALPQLAPGELASRLFFLYAEHEGEGQGLGCDEQAPAAEGRGGAREVPEAMLSLLRDYRPLACLGYDKVSDEALAEPLAEQGFSLLAARYRPDVVLSGCPAFYLALGASRKEVLMCVRGTYSPEDVFTDLLASGSEFGPEGGGAAHSGMAKAATFLDRKFGDLFAALHASGNQVTLIGHSLGAGVAALLALLLRRRGLAGRLRCLAFAPPACMDLPLAESCAGVVTSLVNGDDVVPRLAPEPFAGLLRELADFDTAAAEKARGAAPAALTVVEHLAGLFAPGSAPADTDKGTDGGEWSPAGAQAGYNPFVPGDVVYVCRRQACPAGSVGAQGGLPERHVLQLLRPTSPVLRRMRLTSRMLSDHFIDSEALIAALEA